MARREPASQDLVATDWQVVELADFAQRVIDLAGMSRPAIVAINGHSSSGKTSLSRRLAGALPRCSVLHTDDLAWHHGVFSWDQLLIKDVLPLLRRGDALHYRPPAWIARGREGAITLNGSRQFVIIEGVGASQASMRPELDVILWMDTPQSVRESRDAARIAAGEISATSYANWMAEENAYMARERPWEHADLIADGSGAIDHRPEAEIVLRLSDGDVPSGTFTFRGPLVEGDELGSSPIFSKSPPS